MNENINEIIEKDDIFTTRNNNNDTFSDYARDSSTDISTVNASGISDESGAFDRSETIVPVANASDSDAYTAVSSGDAMGTTSQAEILVETDYTQNLQSIDDKLSVLVFFVLFIWAERKVKSAINKFTGRGIDE